MSSVSESYQGLSQLLDYPKDRDVILQWYGKVASHFENSGLPTPASNFGKFVGSATLVEMQEDYVANFDFNPAAAPYLGHHLYGDNQKKGAFMIKVKQEYGRHGFTPSGCELPDHLSVLLSFLAHLGSHGEDSFRREFIEQMILPGLNKLVEGHARHSASPWLALVEAAEQLCSADCKEVSTC